jgi:hypothetical protein
MTITPGRVLLLAAILVLSAGAARAQAPDSEIDRALTHPGFTWRSLAAKSVRLYYQPGSFAERHRVMLLRSAQAALVTGLAFLGLGTYDREIRVIYVDDRAQMKRLIGRPYSGYADWTGRGVFLVCNAGWRSFDTHEIAHILTRGRWGDPVAGSRWMIEGIPVAVDGWCQTVDINRIARYLMTVGRWPGLSAFTADASALGEIPSGVFAASLLRYLRGHYGAAIIEEIWRSGLVAALKAREVDPVRLEAEWLDSLRSLSHPLTKEEWQRLDARGCG